MRISPFSNEPLEEIADQMGWADQKDAEANLISVVILLCKRVAMLEKQLENLSRQDTSQ